MNRPKAIALCATALIAVLILIGLRFAVVYFAPSNAEWPPRHDGEVVLEEEQFFEVMEESTAPMPSEKAAAPAHNETTVKENVRSAPSKEVTETKRADEARRQADAAMASAFSKKKGSDPDSELEEDEKGSAGSPAGTNTGVSGTGTGTVGGGWSLPTYAKVPATLTGSIKLMVKIDRDGRVTSVSFQGGDAPAATDERLRRAVENEVRSRRFIRPASAPQAPTEATAYITYRFR